MIRIVWLLICGCLGFALPGFERPPERISFLSVGQGDCTLIQSGGLNLVIDAAAATPYQDFGERLAAPELRRLGVVKIDVLFLTHPDVDHVGGLGALSKRFVIEKVAFPDHFLNHEPFMELLKASAPEIPHLPIRAGSQFVWSSGSLGADFAEWKEGKDDNDGSLSLRYVSGRGSAVFTGDAPSEVEVALAATQDWQAQLLKVGHHGSGRSCGKPWLEEVKPSFAIISCGRRNNYRHPSPNTLQRLKDFGVPILRTDESGTLTFVNSDKGFVPSRPQDP